MRGALKQTVMNWYCHGQLSGAVVRLLFVVFRLRGQ